RERCRLRERADAGCAGPLRVDGWRWWWDIAGVPDDFPEVAVGVTKVAGVDPPRAFVSLIGQDCASFLCLREETVYLRLGSNDMSDAELARRWWARGNVRVLGELPARVDREDQTIVELEHHDRSGRVGVVSLVLVGDDALRRESESVPVERQCSL